MLAGPGFGYHSVLVMLEKPEKSIEEIIVADGRYPLAAVQFVREGLNHTVSKWHGPSSDPSGRRHVSGAQLCEGLRELALKRWGLMARQVLRRWHITSTRDFGEIVFLLVNNGWMQKEPEDSLEDFDDVYDFAVAFDRQFEIFLDR